MPKSILITCVLICFAIYHDDAKAEKHCPPASCGDLHDIRYPFRLKINGTSANNCLDSPAHELLCEQNRTILKLFNGTYYVKGINYDLQTIRIVDPGLLRDTCSFRPINPLTGDYFTRSLCGKFYLRNYLESRGNGYATFYDCRSKVESPDYIKINCSNSSSPWSSTTYSYIKLGYSVSHLLPSCIIKSMTLSMLDKPGNENDLSFSFIRDTLRKGFQLPWDDLVPRPHIYCNRAFGRRFLSFHRFWGIAPVAKMTGASLLVRIAPCIIFLLYFYLYKLSLKNSRLYKAVEEFLAAYKNLMPSRYSYSQIKTVTNSFKDKLGQGGFGSVYKGELSNGDLVAVKMLNDSKSKGQDFVNEVATVGRIHHVNVVQLIGFCSEGSKRALVYEFMPNGSLDKYILCNAENNPTLSWDRMHEIALGVARAIEYLHQGCDIQILHFDIKPHNILLDENFNPKISDFGLARFYPRDHNTISVTAARGTMGYIAPEMFYKTIGGVSYKADVYSFGMLLLEMAGRRKNLNAHAEHSSQIYFPSWIYDQLEKGLNIEIEDACEYDKRIAKKMLIVALWCIQLMPVDRPSMTKVLEMLEGEDEVLQMPPKPFFCPQQMPTEDSPDDSDETDIEEVSTMPQSTKESTSMV